jgi:hypothetical protein
VITIPAGILGGRKRYEQQETEKFSFASHGSWCSSPCIHPNTRRGGGMFTAQGTPHNLQAITILATLVAATLMVYWKTVIRFVIMIMVTVVITLIILGAFAIFDIIRG